MINFKNDYNMGAHEKVLEALVKTNGDVSDVYGEDIYTKEAKELICQEIGSECADIYFLSGGTQTNMVAISSILRPHEAVICANTGHINVHETGAIEATGHKVLTVLSDNGKITPDMIMPVIKEHDNIHMVKPKMVYITNATEVGTIYSKKELQDLRVFCATHDLYLYLDGARLGSALTAKNNDLTIRDIAELTDIFYIGGTKNGLLFGEALVVLNEKIKSDFPYLVKTRGALTAKGRILGVQFKALFTDHLFYEIGKRANEMAALLKEGIVKAGYSFLVESDTNQQFIVLPNEKIEVLKKSYIFEEWGQIDEQNTCIRLVTSFVTKEEDINRFIEDISM